MNHSTSALQQELSSDKKKCNFPVLLSQLKENRQDFEWYPTTVQMVYCIAADLDTLNTLNYLSLLDIGAGDGNFFSLITDFSTKKFKDKYAIEKSQILINNMPPDVCIIGTDFHRQSLIDKPTDIIFCNPPYSEYETWTERIIKESYASIIYLIIPDRWVNNETIRAAMKKRKANYTIIESFSFSDSEYRKARANVNIVRIEYENYGGHSSRTLKSDPFDIWFEEHFSLIYDHQKEEVSAFERERRDRAKLHELTVGYNLIDRLVELYQEDLSKILRNYKAVCELDSALLEELNISVKAIKEGLKQKIEGLKNLYWKELFDNLESISIRLTSSSRKKLLDKLMSRVNVDFTRDNVYAVVLWGIKNANHYIDEQLKEMYYSLSDSKNVVLYKSNDHIIKDGWRYQKSEMSHYSLDYRIVHDHYHTIEYSYSGEIKGLKESAYDLINDLFTIAENLGFSQIERLTCRSYGEWGANRNWKPGKMEEFFYFNGKEYDTFAEIRCFKNGNIHFKLKKEFLKKFNIEAARLNGWIKSPQEAMNEINGITLEDATKYYKSNYKMLASNIPILCDKKANTQGVA